MMQSHNIKSVFILLLISAFLIYEMGMQVAPAIITDNLMWDLHLNAVQLGIMGGVYYYTYTLMQIPAGLMFDRYSVRSVTLAPLVICAAGSYLFSIAETLQDAAIARMLMGAGAAFAFIAVLVVAADLFPRRYFAMLAGLAQLLAALGALGGELPLLYLIESHGWRSAMAIIALIGFILAFLIWLFVRYPKGMIVESQESLPLRASLSAIMTNPQTWYIAVYSCLLWAPMAAFASFWGVPYLMKAHLVTRTDAAWINSAMWVGVGLGGPFIGWWSDKWGKRKTPLFLSALLGLVAMLLVWVIPSLSFWLLVLLVFLVGAACAGQVLSFAVIKEINLNENRAAAFGFNNMAVVVAGAIFQPLIGKLVQWHWSGMIQDNLPLYSAGDYQYGMFILVLCFLVALLISAVFIQETNCCQLIEEKTSC